MTRYRLLVESRPVRGREAEYHAWYDGRHSADILRLPGAVRIERFAIVEKDGVDATFFAMVDYETDDLPGILATIGARTGTPDLPSSEAIDHATVRITILRHWRPVAA